MKGVFLLLFICAFVAVSSTEFHSRPVAVEKEPPNDNLLIKKLIHEYDDSDDNDSDEDDLNDDELISESRKSGTYGELQDGDQLVFKRNERAGGTIGLKKKKTVYIPSVNDELKQTIHYIKIIDNKKRRGGKVKIKAGGVGHNYATLKIKSKLGRGYDYTIEAYGS